MAFDNIYVKGATSIIIQVMLRDSTTGMGKPNLTGAAVPTVYYMRPVAGVTAPVAITLDETMTVGTWKTSGWKPVDNTNMPGLYQLGVPDLAIATGANSVEFSFKGTGILDKSTKIVLIDANLRDAVHLGITALPNAAAGAATGLPLSVDASGRVDVLKINGTSQTAGDIKGTLGIPILATMSLDIASVKGAVVAGVAAPLTTTGASTLTTGTRVSGTYANTYLADAVSEVFAPVNPAVGGYGLNLYYDFLLGTNQTVNTVSIFGNYTGAGRYCDLFAYNWVTSSWDQLSNSVTRMNNNNTEASFSYTLLAAHQKSDGTVRIAFKSPSTTTGDRLNVDQILVNVVTAGASASQIAQAVWQFNLPSADVDNSAAEYLRYIFGNFHGYVASASDASHLNIASLPAVANLFVGYRLFIHFEASNIFEGALITAMDASGNITLGTALSATPVADDGIRIYATMIEPDVLTAMTAQGYTTTRAGYLDTLNGLVANVWGYATRVLTASTNIAGMAVNLTQILGAGLTGTAANIVGAFSKFFDKVSPTGTVNSLPDFVAGANGGLPTTNGTKVNQTVDLTAGQTIAATVAAGAIATDAITAASVKADAVTKIQLGLATPTNITAGTITNATNVTNDVGITQAAADKVWGTTARTLSSFGTLIADVWAYATRSLTDKLGFALTSAYDPAKTAAQAGDKMDLVDSLKNKSGASGFDRTTDSLEALGEKPSAADVADAVLATTLAELTTDPGATPAVKDAVMLLFMHLRNKLTQGDPTQASKYQTIANDAGTTILKAAVSDDGSLFTKDKLTTP